MRKINFRPANWWRHNRKPMCPAAGGMDNFCIFWNNCHFKTLLPRILWKQYSNIRTYIRKMSPSGERLNHRNFLPLSYVSAFEVASLWWIDGGTKFSIYQVLILLQCFYGGLVLLSIYETACICRQEPIVRALAFKSFLLYFVGFVLWNIDIHYCSLLRWQMVGSEWFCWMVNLVMFKTDLFLVRN